MIKRVKKLWDQLYLDLMCPANIPFLILGIFIATVGQLFVAYTHPYEILKQGPHRIIVKDDILFFPSVTQELEFFNVDGTWVYASGKHPSTTIRDNIKRAFDNQATAEAEKIRAEKINALRLEKGL